jgi:hypothetical protein
MFQLSTIEKATLHALADACNYSLGAHVPREAVTRRIAANLRGDAKKALRKLRSKGYCIEHPTGRNRTWQLTPKGLAEASKGL